ncbi:hypothetical protein [Pseudochrobactrum sp. MP213Fo]|uniref:hypothetical protein n=1 Tax=Pseudochrobactrum sp. MP213Fo TaxID=3022250 RepID=UPI003BA0CBC0
MRDGFRGCGKFWDTFIDNKLFGANTVYTSGSYQGVEHFLHADMASNVFDFHFAKFAYSKKDLRVFTTNKLNNNNFKLPHLYKITSDTHHTISFKDSYEMYGDRFTAFTHYRTQYPRHEKIEADTNHTWGNYKERYITNVSPLDDGVHASLNSSIKGLCQRSDDVHLKGPVASRAGRRLGGGRGDDMAAVNSDIQYATLEHLDLAVDIFL